MQTVEIESLVAWCYRVERAHIRADADADAQTVYWAVTALPQHYANLVERHGRIGNRPPMPSSAGPVVDLVQYRQQRQARADWLSALGVLRSVLDGALINYRPVGPSQDQPETGQMAR